MRRVICVGNPLVAEDSAGPRVLERLRASEPHRGVEVVDGGLRGLDLLPLFEGVKRVVLVDRVVGVGAPGEVVVLGREEAAAHAPPRCDHSGGLAYLLRCLPTLCEGREPVVDVVGIEGGSLDDDAIEEAAARALALASAASGDAGARPSPASEAP